MKELFERLQTEGISVINELVNTRQQENVQLDFKQKSRPSRPGLDKDDRRVLGPALSALANSNGGLLIVGIIAKKDADRIDAASGWDPINNLAQFTSDAQRAVAELLMPRHEGIQILPIPEASSADRGYLAIWVERSDRRPHRSEAADDKCYYKRAGDSTFVMEHYDVEDAFNRNTVARLELVVGTPRTMMSLTNMSNDGHYHIVPLMLRNTSAVSARAPYFWLSNPKGLTVVGRQLDPGSGLTISEDRLLSQVLQIGQRQIFVAPAESYIHPGWEIPAAWVAVLTVKPPNVPRRTLAVSEEASFEYGFGCEHSRMFTGQIRWGRSQLEDLTGI